MTGFSPQVRAIIHERSDWICEVCVPPLGGDGPLQRLGCQAHHRRPRGAGGSRRPSTNQASNGLWVCAEHHAYIESHRTEALANGWLLRQHEEPLSVPVLYRGTTVYLDDLGNVHDNPQHTEAAS